MAWTDGVDKSTGDIITAAAWNNYCGASGDINLTAPYLASAAGDLFQATGSKVLARLAKGTRNQYLQTNSSTNAVEWAACLCIFCWLQRRVSLWLFFALMVALLYIDLLQLQ